MLQDEWSIGNDFTDQKKKLWTKNFMIGGVDRDVLEQWYWITADGYGLIRQKARLYRLKVDVQSKEQIGWRYTLFFDWSKIMIDTRFFQKKDKNKVCRRLWYTCTCSSSLLCVSHWYRIHEVTNNSICMKIILFVYICICRDIKYIIYTCGIFVFFSFVVLVL